MRISVYIDVDIHTGNTFAHTPDYASVYIPESILKRCLVYTYMHPPLEDSANIIKDLSFPHFRSISNKTKEGKIGIWVKHLAANHKKISF